MSTANLPSSDEALAMDYAMGALDREAIALVRLRQARDPAFAALCHAWADRLATLADAVEPMEPSPELFPRLEAALFPYASIASLPSRLWSSLSFWRIATMASSAAALLFLLLAQSQQGSGVPAIDSPRFAAALAGEKRESVATIAISAGGSAVVVPTGLAPSEKRVPQLWLIPSGGSPRSLGLLKLGIAQQVVVPSTLLTLVAEGATLAVSLEPVGGSPTGLPTGPVVASGKLRKV